MIPVHPEYANMGRRDICGNPLPRQEADSGKAGLAGDEAEGVVNPKNPSPEKQGEEHP